MGWQCGIVCVDTEYIQVWAGSVRLYVLTQSTYRYGLAVWVVCVDTEYIQVRVGSVGLCVLIQSTYRYELVVWGCVC